MIAYWILYNDLLIKRKKLLQSKERNYYNITRKLAMKSLQLIDKESISNVNFIIYKYYL